MALVSSGVEFRDLFERYAPFVVRTLRRMGVRSADLNDVCQDSFVVIHRKLADFDGRVALSTWIYGVCARMASTYRRSARVRLEEPRGNCPEPADTSVVDDVDWQHARLGLKAALAQLDDEERQILLLHEALGFTMAEIAQSLGCPVQTAYSRLHAARRTIKHLVGCADDES